MAAGKGVSQSKAIRDYSNVMIRQILNLGKVLDRTTQRNVHGGGKSLRCQSDSDCCNYKHNSSYGYLYYIYLTVN